MGKFRNARDFYDEELYLEGFTYNSTLEEMLTDRESELLDEIIENRDLLDNVLIHLPPDIETELAIAEDNVLIDTLVDEIEAKSGRKLSDIERIELEHEVLCELTNENAGWEI